MDSKTFREFGNAAVNFIADYMDNIRNWYFCLKFVSFVSKKDIN